VETKKYRTVKFYKQYFRKFLAGQREEIRRKILWTLKAIEELEVVPESYLKHIEGTKGLYEVRVKYATAIFRIFCFFDKGKLIVLANGFQKKTQKTPQSEINKALKIKEEYEKDKK
jgi:phage-related protein